MDDVTLAYAAGFLDGEGTITANYRVSPKTATPALHYRVMVFNTNREILEWFRDTFGGRTSLYGSPRHEHHKQVYSWWVSSQEAASVLRLLLPYLRIKRRQAELVLQMADLRYEYVKGKRGRQVTPAILEARRGLVEEIVRLNHRGALPVELSATNGVAASFSRLKE